MPEQDASRARWSEVEAAFDRALDLDGEALDRHLGSLSPSVADEVRELLGAASAPSALDRSLATGALMQEALDLAGDQPRQIGPYRLGERLGSGGMGVVFRAERTDGAFEDEVAIKVLRWELADAAALERFRREQSILAGLRHPHIATLLDGGVHEGRLPYVVLELVNGISIVEWVASRDADVEQVLELMARVCRAVGHAHRHLVVHRDLKPSNILVREDGFPKLLDFGIAKLLDEEGEGAQLTVDAPRTPLFAAPEQRFGEAVSTATDVWSLGLLLGLLLTGRHSFDHSQIPAIARGEQSPELPSRLVPDERRRRQLRGDLDAIFSKATAFDPEQRYRTADTLADDLERYLEGLPVIAQRQTMRYQARKWVGRHRALVAGGVLALTGLLAGTVTTAWQARRASAERDIARQRAVQAEQTASFLEELFGAAHPTMAEAPTVRSLLDAGAQRVRSELKDAPEVRARLLLSLGDAYNALEEYDVARELMAEAVSVQQGLGTERREYAWALSELAGVNEWSGRRDEAERLYGEALAVLRAIEADDPQFRAILLAGFARVALADGRSDRSSEAVQRLEEAVDTFDNEGLVVREATARASLGSAYQQAGRLDEAERELVRAYGQLSEHAPDALVIPTVASNLALMLTGQGRLEEGMEWLQTATALREEHLEPGSIGRLTNDSNLAYQFLSMGSPAEALGPARRATEGWLVRDPGDPRAIVAKANYGRALLGLNQLEQAKPLLEEVVGALEAAGRPDDAPDLAWARALFGEWLLRAGDLDRAVQVLQSSSRHLEGRPNQELRFARVELMLGAVLCDQAAKAEGRRALDTADAAAVSTGAVNHWLRAAITTERFRCGSGEAAAASEASEKLRRLRGAEDWFVRRAEETEGRGVAG